MPNQSPLPSRVQAGGRIRFKDRLLTETSAAWEQLEQGAIADSEANDLARQYECDFEQRLVRRAAALPSSSVLGDALRHVRGGIGLMIVAGLILAVLAGMATARGVLGVPRDEPVNIFHVLAAMLLPQAALLLVWLVIMFLPRSSGPLLSIASLGGLVVRAGQWISQRLHPGRTYAAAVSGVSRAFLQGNLGRWTFSAISHGLWLAFNIGCLGMLVFLLSTRQYTFAWETTILGADTYQPLTRAIAALPRAAGFITPTDDQIAASRWEGQPLRQLEGTSQAWSSLLVGSLVVYGLAPRLLFLGLSLGQRRLAKSRYRLNVDRPEFARLRGVLEPPMQAIGVVDPDRPALTTSFVPRPSHDATRSRSSRTVGGLPAIIGFELPQSESGAVWPPALHEVRWNDLGMADTREQRRRVLDELARAAHEPPALVIVCSLTTTPDRGVGAFLADLAGSVTQSPALVLTGGQRLRERSTQPAAAASVEARIADWRSIAAAAGIAMQRIVELDLDHLTRSSQARLAELLGYGAAPAQHQRRFEQALDLIAQWARDCDAGTRAADAAAQSALHADIARLYSDSAPRWRQLLRLPSDRAALLPANLGSQLSASAKRFAEILPDRLKRSPKWLAAGATAGALGCVVAAALISPVAIGALPMWSGLGAAIAAVVQPGKSGDATVDREAAGGDGRASIVRSAALFALVLEMQGFDERIITRVLDAVVVDDDGQLDDAGQVRRWLDDLRHRFDLALAKEAQ